VKTWKCRSNPPKSVDAGSLVRKEKPPDPNWGEETVLIKRFYSK